MMLAGYAFESLLKGTAVALDPELITTPSHWGKGILNDVLHSHELNDLAALVKLKLTTKETDLLSRLTAFMWSGRYPVPVTPLAARYSCESDSNPTYVSTDFYPVMDALWQRLLGIFEQAALARQEQNDKLYQLSRKARRQELLSDLLHLHRIDTDGTAHFEDPSETDEPAGAVVCCTCGAQFSLSGRRPAAICRCNVLHHCEPIFDGSLGRIINIVRTYPTDGGES